MLSSDYFTVIVATIRGCTLQKYVKVPASLNVKLNVLAAWIRPLLTRPSPVERLGLGVGDAPLGSGGALGGGVPVVMVWLTGSSFVHVTVVPLTTSTVAGLNAKLLMLMATGFGDAVGLGLGIGLALGADDALAHPATAIMAMRPRPTTRMARRITTSDRVVFSPYARARSRDD